MTTRSAALRPVLVTGATSALVAPLERMLRSAGHSVVLTSRSSGRRVDLTDSSEIDRLLEEVRPSAVAHLAAMVGPACEADPRAAEAVNVDASARLAERARHVGVERFVLASTAAVYAEPAGAHSERDATGNPPSVYGRTKLAAEMSVREALSGSSVQHTAARIFNVWGDGYPTSLPERLRARRGAVVLRGLDGFVRDYVHVEDVAAVLVDLLLPGSVSDAPVVLNVGTGVGTSNRDLVERLGLVQGVDYELGEPLTSRSVADVALLRQWRGHVPETLPTAALSDD